MSQFTDALYEIEKLKRERDWLMMQLLLQKQLTEGYQLLGEANASMRDAALRLKGME